jgi:hypothetical protein
MIYLSDNRDSIWETPSTKLNWKVIHIDHISASTKCAKLLYYHLFKTTATLHMYPHQMGRTNYPGDKRPSHYSTFTPAPAHAPAPTHAPAPAIDPQQALKERIEKKEKELAKLQKEIKKAALEEELELEKAQLMSMTSGNSSGNSSPTNYYGTLGETRSDPPQTSIPRHGSDGSTKQQMHQPPQTRRAHTPETLQQRLVNTDFVPTVRINTVPRNPIYQHPNAANGSFHDLPPPPGIGIRRPVKSMLPQNIRRDKTGAPDLSDTRVFDNYKTKLCKKHLLPKGCPFGKDCIYANGEHELKMHIDVRCAAWEAGMICWTNGLCTEPVINEAGIEIGRAVHDWTTFNTKKTRECPRGVKCKIKLMCLDLHPDEKVTPCENGINCPNPATCYNLHPGETRGRACKEPKICKRGGDCRAEKDYGYFCSYQHPEPETVSGRIDAGRPNGHVEHINHAFANRVGPPPSVADVASKYANRKMSPPRELESKESKMTVWSRGAVIPDPVLPKIELVGQRVDNNPQIKYPAPMERPTAPISLQTPSAIIYGMYDQKNGTWNQYINPDKLKASNMQADASPFTPGSQPPKTLPTQANPLG